MKRAYSWAFFNMFLLIAVSLVLIAITSHSILTLDFYKNAGELYGETPDINNKLYRSLQQYIYFSTTLYILVKIMMISFILYTALYFTRAQVRFIALLNVVVLAEFIFFIPAISKIFLFHVVYPNGGLAEWHRFYILSALSVFPNAPADWLYPLQTLNVFEIAYWFLLGYGIYKISGLSFDRSLRLVVSSYLPALLLWVCIITFCSLVLYPTTG